MYIYYKVAIITIIKNTIQKLKSNEIFLFVLLKIVSKSIFKNYFYALQISYICA